MGYSPHEKLQKALYVLNFWNLIQENQTPVQQQFSESQAHLKELTYLLGILKVENGKAPLHC